MNHPDSNDLRTATSARRGIYTLANDDVFDWLVALLSSIRHVEPDLPITVIPFDDRLRRVNRLRGRLHFDILPADRLRDLSGLGLELWPDHDYPEKLFGKFASFWGPYDSFLFFDTDVIVLEPLTRFFEANEADRDHLYYFVEDRNEVYVPGPLRKSMVAERGSRGFNSGAFGGCRDLLTPEDLRQAVVSARDVEGEFAHRGDQTFLNYAIDISDATPVSYGDVIPGVAHSWAGRRFEPTPSGLVEKLAPGAAPTGTAPLLHWAGFDLSPTMPYFRLWLRERLRDCGPGATAGFLASLLAAPLLTSSRVQRVRHALRLRTRLRGPRA